MKKIEENTIKAKRIRTIFLILLGFLTIGALGGGGAMIISPSGALIEIPLSVLENTLFQSFLVPGIILFIVLGLFPLLLIIALLKKPESRLAEMFNLFKDMHWSWTFGIYIAFVLIGWLQMEMSILQTVHWLHTFYMFYAVAMITIALLPPMRMLYKK